VYDAADKAPVDLFMSNVVELQLLVTRSEIVSIVLVFFGLVFVTYDEVSVLDSNATSYAPPQVAKGDGMSCRTANGFCTYEFCSLRIRLPGHKTHVESVTISVHCMQPAIDARAHYTPSRCYMYTSI
jgi:hypothetical protein